MKQPKKRPNGCIVLSQSFDNEIKVDWHDRKPYLFLSVDIIIIVTWLPVSVGNEAIT